jgi:hypothetical protein
MVEASIPADIIALADERRRARVEREWGRADELRAQIEAAGWRVIDAGMEYSLEPARPADVERDGETIYGSVDSVPSRLHEPESCAATVVVVAQHDDAQADAVLGALASSVPEATQVLVVAPQDTPITGPADEIIRSVVPLSPGDALQAGLRRACGAVVIALEPDWVPSGDVVTPLLAALADDSVAVAGVEGLRSVDLRRYQPASPGEATAVRSGCYAFRRHDAMARGPLDGRLNLAGSVAAWWSLTLRDEGPDTLPRRALALDLPFRRSGDATLPEDHARLARRDAYRIADHFRRRRWLAAQPEEVAGLPGDGAGGDDQDDGADEEADASQA